MTNIEKLESRTHEIDFGTGKLYYSIEPGSAITVNEIMHALSDVAMVVPLTHIAEAIKKLQ